MSCPACGHAAPAGSKFCNECGARLAAAPAPPATAPAERVPRDYTPRHLADKILTSRSALQGERKLVTVLFCDVKSSMELAEELDPEDWHAVLDRFFEILTDGVHRFEGTVNQYTGDGIMALFGAPIAHEDHAERACHAALHVRGGLESYADEVRRSHGLNFEVRMGLNSGEVVVGRIGDDLRMDYTAQGHTVGLAQRVEELAAPGRANLTEQTARIVDGFFRLRDLGEFRLRGVKGSTRIYELEGAGRHRTRLDRARARGLTRFVGRTEELSVLQDAFERALEGRAQVVGVVGEAGVGKSRLCDEFLRQLAGRNDIQIGRTQALPHGQHTPLVPWIQMMRSLYGVLDSDDPPTARRKVAGEFALRYPELIDEYLGVLLDFLGTPDPDRPRSGLDPDARVAAIAEFMRRASARRAHWGIGVFLWDDLQWLDPASEALFARQREAVADTRTFNLVNFRPGYRADWMEQGAYREIALRPLDPEEIETMVAHVLGSDPSAAALPALLRERTGGNPFFMEETLRSLVEAGHLKGQSGAYRMVSPPGRLTVPDSVQGVLAARIDRLDERAKRLLQTAAVVGKRFSLPVLERVADRPGSAVREALADLEAAAMIHGDSQPIEIAEYSFEHPLTHEVAYHSQLGERRRPLHAAVARAVEAESRERSGENAALIAHHWEEAGERLEAARWHRRAAGWVGGRDWEALDHHLRKTIEHVDALPPNDEIRRWGAIARSALIGAAIRTGSAGLDEAQRLFDEARALFSEVPDESALVMLLAGFGALVGTLGDPEAHYRHAAEGRRLAERSGDDVQRMAVMPPFLWGCAALGKLREGLERAEQALLALPDDDELGFRFSNFSARLMTRLWRAHLLLWAGRIDEAEAETEAVLSRAADRDEPETAMWGHTIATSIGFARGDRSATELHARGAVDAATRYGSSLSNLPVWLSTLRDHLAAGRSEEAARTVDRIHEHGLRRDRSREHDAAGMMARAYLAAGEHERARDSARRWAESAHPRSPAHADGLLALAHVELAAGAPDGGDAIRSLLDQASELVGEIGLLVLQPRVHERRAELAALEGDDDLRRDQLERARSLHRGMGAHAEAERIERELEA